MKTCTRFRYLRLIFVFPAGVVMGCSSQNLGTPLAKKSFLSEGSILLSRPLLRKDNSSPTNDQNSLETSFDKLGFSASLGPSLSQELTPQLVFNDTSLSVKLSSGETYSVPLSYAEPALVDPLQIQAKAENYPEWHASSEYFSKRNLEVPEAYSSERFLRGPFGRKALFISATRAIHCNQLAALDVGGIVVKDCTDLEKLFQDLPLATPLEREKATSSLDRSVSKEKSH